MPGHRPLHFNNPAFKNSILHLQNGVILLKSITRTETLNINCWTHIFHKAPSLDSSGAENSPQKCIFFFKKTTESRC